MHVRVRVRLSAFARSASADRRSFSGGWSGPITYRRLPGPLTAIPSRAATALCPSQSAPPEDPREAGGATPTSRHHAMRRVFYRRIDPPPPSAIPPIREASAISDGLRRHGFERNDRGFDERPVDSRDLVPVIPPRQPNVNRHLSVVSGFSRTCKVRLKADTTPSSISNK